MTTPRLSAIAGAAALALCGTAHAHLVLVSPVDFQGTGLGNVNTILTIGSPGSGSFESGAVAWNGSADVTSGDAKTGASQTQTRTLGDLGVTSAANLRVVFNALEPGSAPGIDLTTLTLNVFSAAGATVFSAPLDHAYSFANTFSGAGNSGFVFALDAGEAATLQGIFNSNLRIGLSASADNATGGFETFFVANSPTVAAIPEPETYALMLGGLGLMGFIARRRRDAR